MIGEKEHEESFLRKKKELVERIQGYFPHFQDPEYTWSRCVVEKESRVKIGIEEDCDRYRMLSDDPIIVVHYRYSSPRSFTHKWKYTEKNFEKVIAKVRQLLAREIEDKAIAREEYQRKEELIEMQRIELVGIKIPPALLVRRCADGTYRCTFDKYLTLDQVRQIAAILNAVSSEQGEK